MPPCGSKRSRTVMCEGLGVPHHIVQVPPAPAVARPKRFHPRSPVELALETGPPSGRVSVEQVVNVLRRLNAMPLPQNAATTLQVTALPASIG